MKTYFGFSVSHRPLFNPSSEKNYETLWWQHHHVVGKSRHHGKVDEAKYWAILEGNLFEAATFLRPSNSDNDPKHTARATMKWIRSKPIHALEWPILKSRPKSY